MDIDLGCVGGKMTREAIISDDVIDQIADALGIDMHICNRIILDFACGKIPQIYVAMVGTKELIKVDWEAALKGSEVIKIE